MQFELSHEDYFDAIIVNDALEDALKEAERLVEGFLGIRSEHTTFWHRLRIITYKSVAYGYWDH